MQLTSPTRSSRYQWLNFRASPGNSLTSSSCTLARVALQTFSPSNLHTLVTIGPVPRSTRWSWTAHVTRSIVLTTKPHTNSTCHTESGTRISESPVGYAIIIVYRHAPSLSRTLTAVSTARIATDTEKQQSQTDRKGKIVIAVCLQRPIN